MALTSAASTHLIKVMEPMVTAVIAWLAVGVTVSKSKLLALALVLIGAVGASWDPSSTFPTHGLGMQIALLSNNSMLQETSPLNTFSDEASSLRQQQWAECHFWEPSYSCHLAQSHLRQYYCTFFRAA